MNTPVNPADFVTLWSHHARRVHAYIHTLVYNVADADDIFQETSATLWAKYHEFQPGTDFGAWAAQIAYFQVRNWQRKRRPLQPLEETLFDLLSTETAAMQDLLDARFEALTQCLRKLGSEDRKLLDARYRSKGSVKSIAEQCGLSLSNFYRELRQIHRKLFDCIQRRLGRMGSDG